MPYDPEGDEITVEWTLTSKGQRIITTDEETISIRASDSTPEFVGVYSIKVKLTDDNTDPGSLSTEYEFYINLKEDPENPVHLWKDEEFELPEEIITWDQTWDEEY